MKTLKQDKTKRDTGQIITAFETIRTWNKVNVRENKNIKQKQDPSYSKQNSLNIGASKHWKLFKNVLRI